MRGRLRQMSGPSVEEVGRDRLLAGKYRLGRLIGEGGMGAVYEAEHIGLGAMVAVKLLSDAAVMEQTALARFRREARAMGAVRHDNVVAVMDADSDVDGTPFLVMEYLDGESLSSILRRERSLSPRTAAAVVCQILAGLRAAHRVGIIHRDLKPGNVFVCRQSDGTKRIKILDFGVSKLGDGSQTLNVTADGVLVGTPTYMAPEQVEGRPDIDARTDLYAAGVILYRCATGRLPYSAGSPDKLYRQILEGRATPPRELNPKLPAALEKVILRALARRREDRYQSAEEFIQALEIATPNAATDDLTLPTHETTTGVGSRSYSSRTRVDTPTRPASPRSLTRRSAANRGARTKRWIMRGRIAGGAVLVGLLAWMAWGLALHEDTRPSLKIGVVHYLPNELLHRQYRPLVSYLERSLGRDVELVVAQDHDELSELLLEARIGLAALSSYNYVRAKKAHPGIRLLATPVVPGGATSYEGLILTRADSGIESLSDLRGKRFCYVDPGSSSGYLYPRALMIAAGLRPDHDLRVVQFGGDHLATLRLLYRGRCDGAAVFASILYEAGDHGLAPQNFRVLASTQRIPQDAYCVPPGLEEGERRAIQDALLALKPGSARAREVFSNGSPYVGFAPISDHAYDAVRAMVGNLDRGGAAL